MDFNHFIITRFNLKFTRSNWKLDKQKNAVLTDEWLSHRMRLFLNYCLPSVLNQSVHNFTWVLYVDSETNYKVKCKLKDISHSYSFIKIIFVDSYETFEQTYCNKILELNKEAKRYIITTRLDNDDVIHADFVKRIQKSFNYQNYMAVNFLKVLMINPRNTNKIHIDYQFSNHFVSVIEVIENKTICGCYSKGDVHWDVKGKVIQIMDKPYCLEIISDRNMINRFRGLPVLRKVNLKNFQISDTFKYKINELYTLNILKMSWKKYFRYLFENNFNN